MRKNGYYRNLGEEMMDEEAIYLLMMEALDGELSDAGRSKLEAHLLLRPDLAREWRLLQAVDHLFKETPALSPALDFAQKTVYRLPNIRYRLWTMSSFYLLVLLSGLLPMAIITGLVVWLGPTLFEPAFWSGVGQLTGVLVDVVRLVWGAIWQLLMAFGEQASQQPALWGWLFVMVGMIALWRGVYEQLMMSRA